MPPLSVNPPSGGGGGAGTGLIDVPKGYVPPSSPGYVPVTTPITGEQGLAQESGAPFTTALTPPAPGQVSGTVTPYNEFGQPSVQPQYTEQNVWDPGNDPTYVPILQRRLVEAGLLKPYGYRPGSWDAPSAAAYRTLLAFANHVGATDHEALDYMIANPKIPKSSRSSLNPRSTTYVANPANVRSEFQNAAEQLTGGDLPASQADSFLNYYAQQEMKAAAGTLTTQAMTPEAYIRQNDQGAIHAYEGLSRYLEFLRMLHVSI